MFVTVSFYNLPIFKLSESIFTRHAHPIVGTKSIKKQRQTLCYRYSKELSIPHFPDMVFPKNILKLTHNNGSVISFNPLDALKCVKSTVRAVEVSCAEAWQEAR